MKKPTLSPRIAVILLILAAFWGIGSGMYGLMRPAHPLDEAFSLFEKGQRYKGTPDYSSHSYASVMNLAVILPTGKEHYYLIGMDNNPHYLVVRTAFGYNKLTELDHIDGVIRQLDFDDRQELDDRLRNGETVVTGEYYLDAAAPLLYTLRIVAGAVGLLVIGLVGTVVKAGHTVSKAMRITAMILLLGEIYLLLFLVSMA